ncbi:MAG: hypothetical protein OEZ06_09905 [Myxococcales bacterium]|nr:hypothetical protein [Myxococcales bacterium]
MGRRTKRQAWLAMAAASTVTALSLAGCEQVVRGGLDEHQANALILALDNAGVAARKRKGRAAAVRGAAGYEILVQRDRLPEAIRIADAAPAQAPAGPPLGDEDDQVAAPLVPTPGQQRLAEARAIAARLERSLVELEGIRAARVHLSLPDPAARPLDEPHATASASVLLWQAADGTGSAEPPDDGALRRLVAGAVSGLRPEAVALLRTAAPTHPRPPSGAARSHGARAARDFRAGLGASLALNAVLAIAVALLWRRRSRPDLAGR